MTKNTKKPIPSKLPFNKLTINEEVYVKYETILNLEKQYNHELNTDPTIDMDNHDKFIASISVSDFVDKITALEE